MKSAIPITIWLLITLMLVACDGGNAWSKEPLTADLSAQQSNLEAQLASVRRAQTVTAEAIARAATAEAKQTRQAIDAANARATTEAKQTAQAQAARTATMRAYAFNLTATADPLTLAQHHTDATATADAAAIVRAGDSSGDGNRASHRATARAKGTGRASRATQRGIVLMVLACRVGVGHCRHVHLRHVCHQSMGDCVHLAARRD